MNWALLFAIALFFSCHRNTDPFFGRWTVEKVNVDFDEHIASPEMVKQYGEMEKGNVIEISKDSTLMFISEGDTLKMHCVLEGKQILCDGNPFGYYENGVIQTESSTPLGKIIVIYSK